MRESVGPYRVYLVLVALTAAQLGLLVVSGTVSHVSLSGTAVVIVLLAALLLRSRIAWGLLVALNAIPLLAVVLTPLLAVIGGRSHILWVNFALMFLTGIALEATLCSVAMRDLVGQGRARHGNEGHAPQGDG